MTSEANDLFKELETFMYKLQDKKQITDFPGNIYDVRKADVYTLKSNFLDVIIRIYDSYDPKILFSEIIFDASWQCFSYDSKSLSVYSRRTKELIQVMKILKKYTIIPNEKNLLLGKLEKIKQRKKKE